MIDQEERGKELSGDEYLEFLATEEGEEGAEAARADDEHSADAIKIYLKELQKRSLLSAEEERKLAYRIAEGDQCARDRLVESNLRLVVKIAKRYMNRGLPFLDLIEEGNIGLIKAVDKFQVSKGFRFSTYATWWIRQSIERALVNQGRTIRLPVHISDDVNRMVKISSDLRREAQRKPQVTEIAQAMGVDPAYVKKLMLLSERTYSIEHPMGKKGDYELGDTLKDPSTVDPSSYVENRQKFDQVEDWMRNLSESERTILALRFGLDDRRTQTLNSIGRQFRVSRERIRQIEAKSLAKIRGLIEEQDAPTEPEEDPP